MTSRTGRKGNRAASLTAERLKPAPAHFPIVVDLEPLLNSISQYDHASLDNLLNRHAVILPTHDLVFSVVLPLLREVGRRWEAGTLRPAQEHLISAIVRHLLGALLRTMPRRAEAPVMVLATPEGERHELGLLCATLLAACAGHTGVYLGADLSATDVLDAVKTLKGQTLVLAATMNVSGTAIRTFRRLPPEINLWIGGPRCDQLQTALGPRAVVFDTLDAFASRL